jgi:exonuclease III
VNLTTKPRDSYNGKTHGKRNKDRKELRIGTWNIRTLFKLDALKTVIDKIKRYKLPIVALQEVRWPRSGNIRSGNHTIFYSGSEDGKYEYGVGLLIDNSMITNMKEFTAINDRLCYICIKGQIWDIILMNCYAPTEDKNNDIKSAYYEELENIYDTLPRNTVKIIIEDFNAEIGREPVYKPTIG